MSGAMMSMLLASGTPKVVLTNRTITSNTVVPTSASATIRLVSDGRLQRETPIGTVDIAGEWLVGGSNGANYEARVTLISGTLSSGTVGSWLSLGTSRAWNVEQTTVGTKTCQFTLEIRRASDAVVGASATITLEATEEP